MARYNENEDTWKNHSSYFFVEEDRAFDASYAMILLFRSVQVQVPTPPYFLNYIKI